MPAPTLTDGVVTLTAHRLEDAPEILRGRQLPEVERAWFGRKVRDLDDARYQIEYALARWAEEENFFWAFAIRASAEGPLMGSVILHHSSRGAGSVLDIWLLPEHRGGDVAWRASRLALGYAFDERAMPWVDVEIRPDNHPATQLAGELGFGGLDELRGVPGERDVTMPFRMTRGAWDLRDGAG